MAEFNIDALLITAIAGFLAGVINAIAGGGSLISFPALVFVGVPGISANATSALAVLPGYLGGSLGFHKELSGFDRRILMQFCIIAIMGAFIGAFLLLLTPSQLFDFIIPLLLLLSTSLFAFKDRLLNYFRAYQVQDEETADIPPIISPYWGLFFVAIYGGYFNGGLGILLLALFALMGLEDIHAMNGLKSLLSFVLSLMSVTTYIVAGIIDWRFAAIMMVMASFGGYFGARWSKRLNPNWVSNTIIAVGLILTIVFIVKLFF